MTFQADRNARLRQEVVLLLNKAIRPQRLADRRDVEDSQTDSLDEDTVPVLAP